MVKAESSKQKAESQTNKTGKLFTPKIGEITY